jgi:hypothetical protein
MTQGDMPPDVRQKAWQVCSEYEKAIEGAVRSRNLLPGVFPALNPCNLLIILDSQNLFVAFTNINAGGVPRHIWADRRTSTFSAQQVLNSAVAETGMAAPSLFQISAAALDATSEARESAINQAASRYVDDIFKLLTRPQALVGYEGLQDLLDRFVDDHSVFEKNVFVAMRFRSAPHFAQVYSAIKEGLASHGLKTHRADDKVYPLDGDLWNNVCVYMMGCKYAICVFEEMDEREFNPNVPLEYGFMRAMNRQVLLLKEQRMPKMPTDITGKLFKPFDMMDIDASIKKQVALWAERDLGFQIA